MVLVAAAVLLATDGVSALRLRKNPNRGKYSTAAPLPAEEASPVENLERISVDPLDTTKFSFSDPAAEKFKTPLESDRKVKSLKFFFQHSSAHLF